MVDVRKPEEVRVDFYPVDAYLNHSIPILPSGRVIVEDFAGGEKGLQWMICDLDAAIALGAYDMSKIEG